MDKDEAIERLEYLKARAQIILEQEMPDWIAEDVLGTIEAYDMAIEALQTEPTISKMEQVEDEPQLHMDGYYRKDDPKKVIGESFPSYITEDRATQVLDGWQANPRTSTTAVEDEPQTRYKVTIPYGDDVPLKKIIELELKDEPQTSGVVWTEDAIKDEPKSYSSWASSEEPQTDCGDFADRLAYERGVKHAWKVAQKVFDSTVTFYEAEDVAKQIDKDINVRSKDDTQTERSR